MKEKKEPDVPDLKNIKAVMTIESGGVKKVYVELEGMKPFIAMALNTAKVLLHSEEGSGNPESKEAIASRRLIELAKFYGVT